jgi:L-fucose mutarotase
MLKSIDPLLNADVLHALRSMGHGNELVLVDTNFPADAVARLSGIGRLLHMENATAARAAKAVLSVMPLDSFVPAPVLCMDVIDKPGEPLPVQAEVQREVDAAEGKSMPMGRVERFAFYELAKKTYCIILTGERRFYGNFILKMGVVPPEA